MEFSALEIATFLNGEIIGDPTIKINNVSKIEDGKPGTLTFLANLKYENFLYETKASVVLINADFVPVREVKATMIKVKDAYAALSSLLDLYVKSVPEKKGIEQPNFIDSSAKIDGPLIWEHFAT
jgi:UDP-3-O-[3-hydroxymyristoyl] glucosamine N-acyltransferase